MILKKVIENDKEIYVPISFEEAVKIYVYEGRKYR